MRARWIVSVPSLCLVVPFWTWFVSPDGCPAPLRYPHLVASKWIAMDLICSSSGSSFFLAFFSWSCCSRDAANLYPSFSQRHKYRCSLLSPYFARKPNVCWKRPFGVLFYLFLSLSLFHAKGNQTKRLLGTTIRYIAGHTYEFLKKS